VAAGPREEAVSERPGVEAERPEPKAEQLGAEAE
jgi:hypothetical protein